MVCIARSVRELLEELRLECIYFILQVLIKVSASAMPYARDMSMTKTDPSPALVACTV